MAAAEQGDDISSDDSRTSETYNIISNLSRLSLNLEKDNSKLRERDLDYKVEIKRLIKDIKDRDGMLDEGEIMLERERREIRRLHEAHKAEVENRNIYYEEELARQHKNRLEHIDQLQEQHQRTAKHIHEDRDYELKELRDRLEAEVARLTTDVRLHVRPTLEGGAAEEEEVESPQKVGGWLEGWRVEGLCGIGLYPANFFFSLSSFFSQTNPPYPPYPPYPPLLLLYSVNITYNVGGR